MLLHLDRDIGSVAKATKGLPKNRYEYKRDKRIDVQYNFGREYIENRKTKYRPWLLYIKTSSKFRLPSRVPDFMINKSL